MTWESVLSDVIVSIVASSIFWILSFAASWTKVIFADVIEKSMIESYGDGDAIYMIRIMNIGRRDLLEIDYSAKITIGLEYVGRKMSQICYLNLENDITRPVLKGRGKKTGKRYYRSSTFRFLMNDASRTEFLKPYYSDSIRQEAKNNTLSLDDLFREYGENVTITIYVRGTDRVTGARKVFGSREYTSKDIKLGKYRAWYWGMKRIPHITIRRKAIMTRAISNFETIEEYMRDTSVDPLALLENTNSEARADFLSDEKKIKPDNAYNKIDIAETRRKINKLKETLDFIDKTGVLREDMELYVYLMNYNLQKLYIVEACYDYLHAASDAEKAEIAQKHQEANNALYDNPDRKVFESIVSSAMGNGSIPAYQPANEIRSRFEIMLDNHLKDILSVVSRQELYTTEDVCRIMNLALSKTLHADICGWKAVIKKDATYASVDPKNKTVTVPGNRSKGEYTYESVRSTIAHEIGTHVFRSVYLDACPCSALKEGLPKYDGFEEGLATIVEQSITHDYRHPGIRHYISIGLASINHLNFRDTFERLLAISKNMGEKISDELVFDSVQRAFRGTGELVFSKDLAYYTGYEKAWKFIEQHIDDRNLMNLLFYSGKTDPTNEEHMSILKHNL